MKVLIAGDFAPRARLDEQIKEMRFSEIFPENLREIIKSTDFSFVNFESPIVESSYNPIPKCGPNLHCTQEAAMAVRYAGFTGVTMANNHILDYGADGLYKTVECCLAQGLDVVGVGDNLKDAGKILYIEKGGITLAVINCCEHEFSIATETEVGANPLNPINQFYAIQEGKKNADYVLVIVHGGHEHYQLPSLRMKETYRFFIDAGADAVVNHHQHCYSGYEIYNGKPIFYGLGNFCFDVTPTKANTIWNYGYMVEILFCENIQYRLIPYNQYGEKAEIALLEDCNLFERQINQLNSIISDFSKLKKASDEYYSSTAERLMNMYQPYYEYRFLNKLFKIGLLPSLISHKRMAMLYNYLNCEAHRDKQIFAFREIVKKLRK